MHLPFLDQAGTGLHLTDQFVYRVDLRRRWRTVAVQRFDREPVAGGDVEAALKRLALRHASVPPVVACHLDDAHVRVVLLEHPAPLTDEARTTWINRAIAERFPRPSEAGPFLTSTQVLVDDEYTRCLVAVAHPEAVHARETLLRNAGLAPVALGSLDLDGACAFAFDPSFADGTSHVILHRPGRTVRLSFENGRLHRIDAGDEALPNGGPIPSGFHLRQPDDPEAPASIHGAAPALALLTRNGLPLPDAYLWAAALAVKHLFPSLSPIDLITSESRETARQARAKQDALTAVLGLGVLLAVLLVLPLVGTAVLNHRLQSAGDRLLASSEEAAAVQQARHELAQLRQRLRDAEALIAGRTHVATLLDDLARAVPDSVWLRALVVRLLSDGSEALDRDAVHLTGYALDESNLAVFLDRLERYPGLTRVRVVRTEAVPADAVSRAAGGQWRHSLTRFELRANVVPHP